MRKTLLTCGTLLLAAVAQKASAQLALENFNTTTTPGSLPANWVMINDGHTVSSSFGNATIAASLTANAWIPLVQLAAGNYSMITTSLFNPSAASDRWLITPSFTVTSANTIFKWTDYDFGSHEVLKIMISTSAGTTAAAFNPTPIYMAPAGPDAVVVHGLSLSAYNGQTIRLAFRDNNAASANNFGLLVDDVSTSIQANLVDGALTAVVPAAGSAFIYSGTSGAAGSKTIGGTFYNNGAQAITTFTASYKQGANATVTQTFTPTTPIQPLASYNFTFTTPLTITSAGSYPVREWISATNDGNHSNDTSGTSIVAVDSIQKKYVLFEEFNQASCDPCAQASANVDSVIGNNRAYMNAIRYHVNFPGRDCMDSVTYGPFVHAMLSYYAVSGVPDAKMDGSTDVYPGAGSFTSDLVRTEASAGTPVKINVTATYNVTTHTYTVNGTIKSFVAIPAGAIARAVLTVDTIKYRANQSTESIPQTVFPQVAENMFPSSAGMPMAAFAAGSSQNFTSTWVKDHPWGSDRAQWAYDSTAGGHVTLWIQDPSSKYVYQSATVAVGTLYTSGVPQVVGKLGEFSVFPNPATSDAIVALDLKSNASVKLEIMNMLGQAVFTLPAETRNAGKSSTSIDLSSLSNGNYVVNVTINGEVLSHRLTVAK